MNASPARPAAAPAGPAAQRRPILVTGAPRSGTTWVGNMLALAPEAGDMPEPFNRTCRDGVCRIRFPGSFTYITPANEAAYLGPLTDTLAWRYSPRAEIRTLATPRDLARMVRDLAYFEAMRRRNIRPVMKDPLAVFSAEWLAARFDMQVVVVLRHPAAFTASLRAKGWHRFDFRTLLDQPLLMAERLAPFRDEISAAARERPDPVAASVLLWRILYHHLHLLRDEHPDWIFLRHEDASKDPAATFRDLYARLGLTFSDRVQSGLERRSTRPDLLGRLSLFGRRRRTVRNSRTSAAAFRDRLTQAEIDRITATAGPLLDAFYGDRA